MGRGQSNQPLYEYVNSKQVANKFWVIEGMGTHMDKLNKKDDAVKLLKQRIYKKKETKRNKSLNW